jgi:hypothetical protein
MRRREILSAKRIANFYTGHVETEAFEEGNVKPESTMSTNETIGLIIRGLIIFIYKEY